MITINLKPGSKRATAGASLAGGMNALRSMRTRVKDPWPMGALVVVAALLLTGIWIIVTSIAGGLLSVAAAALFALNARAAHVQLKGTDHA